METLKTAEYDVVIIARRIGRAHGNSLLSGSRPWYRQRLRRGCPGLAWWRNTGRNTRSFDLSQLWDESRRIIYEHAR